MEFRFILNKSTVFSAVREVVLSIYPPSLPLSLSVISYVS